MVAERTGATLRLQLEAEREAGLAEPGMSEAREEMLAHLRDARLVERARRVGDLLPPFQLPNTAGAMVTSSELQARGPLVIAFFRGDWCPYCTLTLRALNENLPEFERLGASFVAIGPESIASMRRTKEMLGLNFDLLSDANLDFATAMGLAFVATAKLIAFLKSRAVDLRERYGIDRYLLPIPATYVVDRRSQIRYAYVDEDFTTRAEPDEILSAVRVVSKF